MYLRCDYNTEIWLEIPHFDEFDPWQDPRVWAEEVARDTWVAAGLKPRSGEVENLCSAFVYLAERRMEDDTPRSEHFVYLPHPQGIPQQVITWIAHHPECRLEDWVIADDPEAWKAQ